jgi:hypothetical protein
VLIIADAVETNINIFPFKYKFLLLDLVIAKTGYSNMKQTALTLITPVVEGKLEALRTVLSDRKDTLKQGLRSLGTVHYARFVIVEETTIGNEFCPAQLAFSSNFDGDVDTHIEDLAINLNSLLDEVYTNCVDYTPQNRSGYLKKISIKEAAFYVGAPGRTVKIIEQEKQLRNHILEIIDSNDWEGKSAKDIHRHIQKEVLSNPEYDWAKEKVKTPAVNWPGLILFGLVLVILLPVIVLWAIFIQVFYERKDKPLGLTPNQLDDAQLKKMQQDEDFVFQNQFSQIITMKPGRPRLITVNALYLFARVLIKLLFIKGKLMGIPTIHFARWVMVNNNKRMLFFSNFDGSWTQYLGDFIDKSGWGLTGIFGNTMGFPRAFMLVFKGAYNEQYFLAWARYTQIQTQIWYAADLTQSIKNVNNNTLIRNDLSSALNEKQAKTFLARI